MTPRDALLTRKPRVLNKRTDAIPPDAVYVGRPSMWGNPFRIGVDGTREQVLEWYKEWFHESNLIPAMLRGKDLVCWCAPEPCHADYLLEMANSNE